MATPEEPISAVCISRLVGAGGEEIGRLLAERLGFRYVDAEIVVAAAQAEGLYPESVAAAEERGVGRLLEVDFHRFEPTEEVRELIRTTIRSTAAKGNVVIVAHAASFALAGDGVLRVLAVASPETRVARLQEDQGVDPRTAKKVLDESDRARKEYLERFYGIGRELPTHFDLVVNTDVLGVARAVDVIAAAAT